MGFHQSCNPKGVPRQGSAHNHRDESIPGLQPSSFFQSGLALIILRRQCRTPWPNRRSPRRCEAASRLPQLEREMENREDKGRKLQVNCKHTKKGEYSIPFKQMGGLYSEFLETQETLPNSQVHEITVCSEHIWALPQLIWLWLYNRTIYLK